MNRTRLAACLVAALTALAGTAAASPAAAPAVATDRGTLVKAIVKYDGAVTPARLDALAALGIARGFELRSIDAVAVTATPAALRGVADLPGVTALVPQRRIVLDLYASKAQIHADAITEAGTYERDGGSFSLPGYDGSGVTVGIIDSGIFAEHPGLAGKVTMGLNFEFTEFQDRGLFTPEQWDQYAEGSGYTALQDEVGHGTHVAGTVGGTGAGGTQYEQHELAGIAPGAEFVALKIASAANGVAEDYGFEENALFAIDYLIRHPETGVKLTNNSWGLLPVEPSTLEGTPLGEATDYDAANDVVSAAAAAGITMVFSAGNDGPEPGTIRQGPGADNAILVAAACKSVDNSSGCTEGQVIADFSSRGNEDGTGPQVDVTAPGDSILAPASPSILIPLSRCADRGEPAYYCLSGTSMSSPHVAGVVALMQQANPDLTPAEAEACLKDTATDLMDPGFDIHSGMGMVDTPYAIACATGVSPAGAQPPAPAPEPAPAPTPLPATGGGLALLGLLAVGGAAALRRS